MAKVLAVLVCVGGYFWFIYTLAKSNSQRSQKRKNVSAVKKTSRSYGGGTAGSWGGSSGFDELTTEDYIMLDGIEDMFDR